MPLPLDLPAAIPVPGVQLVTLAAGIKRNGTPDLVLMALPASNRCAAVFTRNAFCAAPVTVAREQLADNEGEVRALLINSGNANAGTGEPGVVMARACCQWLAESIGVPAQGVLPFSTGVIGQLLPEETMRRGIGELGETLCSLGADTDSEHMLSDQAAWEAAARGIMTTDTQMKLTSRQCVVGEHTVTLTGMAKGAGMIEPNMATMLGYVFTDASIPTADLQAALQSAVADSFNAITVDSDTSTNDACVLCATGTGAELDAGHADWDAFMAALKTLCLDLAQAIIRDAEGASKFITVTVEGGRDRAECRQVAYAIANSPLVKTAMSASDANVGRLLMAIGKAGVEELDPHAVEVSIGDVLAFAGGGIAEGYTEARGSAVMAEEVIVIRVDLQRGEASSSVYTSDLSHEYVTINAEYRT